MTVTAHARRWQHGWELHVEGVGVTQVRTLEYAKRQVCDLVETLTEARPDEGAVNLVLDVGVLGDRLEDVRALTREATDLQRRAALASRQLVADLRAAHLSNADIAMVLGISRGRVSQLMADAPEPSVSVTQQGRRTVISSR